MLNTETPSTRHPDLDTYATPALLDAFIDDQAAAVAAVKAAAPQLAAAVDAALPRIRAGGRLLYAGAGTSECKTAKSGCKGQNGCKGQGWISKKSAEECTKAGGKVEK